MTLYEPLYGIKRKRGSFQILDFKPEESNEIISGLVRRIEQYEQNRGMKIDYDKVMTDMRERIVRAKMKSEDNVVQGVIVYSPSKSFEKDLGRVGSNAVISAMFYFNSEDESLRSEYQGLAKLIREM